MALFNGYHREYQPDDGDYNTEFVREHIRRSLAPAADDGRLADPDATLGRLIGSTLDEVIPAAHPIDATIRVGLPAHGALVGVIMRHAVEFTLIYVLAQGIYRFDHSLLPAASAWCVVNFLFLGIVITFARQDATLFFYGLAHLWGLFAVLSLTPIVYAFEGARIAIAAGLSAALMWVVMLRGIYGMTDAVEKSLRLVLAASLAVLLASSHSGPAMGLPLVRGLLLLGNYVLTLPLIAAMQHWFAAHRYASLRDVRRYGSGADAVGRLGLLPLTAVWAHGAAASCGWASSTMVTAALVDVMEGGVPASAAHGRLLQCLGLVALVAVGNWLATELLYHGRRPRPTSFLHSYYTAWRTLAAWLSYDAPVDHPAAFQFMRPWSSRSMRVALISVCLSFNAAIAFSGLSRWTEQYVRERAATGAHQPSSEAKASTSSTLEALISPRYFAIACGCSVLSPALLLFLSIHAAWGPALEAYSEHFDRFHDAVVPPLVTFRFRSSAELSGVPN